MKKSLKAKFVKNKRLIPFVLPAMIFALLFCYLPMVGVLLAFKENPNFGRYGVIEAFMKSNWTMDNFKLIFSDKEILRYLSNTLIISMMKIIILFPLPIILAIMISEVKNKFFSFLIQGLVFLPHFLSWVVVTGIFNGILDPYGPVCNFLKLFGYTGGDTTFMGNKDLFRWLVVIISGWKEIGYSSIVYIAAISAINPQLYEAAKIDGAGKLKQAWHVTIPGILTTIVVMFIIRIGYLMDAGFEQIQTMISGPTRETGEIIGTYVYRIGLGSNSSDYGLSTAVGLFNGVISMILILCANAFSKKKFGTGIW